MLDKRYNAEEIEKKWQKFWEKNKLYKFDSKSKKPIYSIDTPPPYASSGHLHIGHALHYTQFEIIARFRRMKGYNVHFPPCFDNNGLPTEKYVEEKFKISKADTTRAEFRKLCLKESRDIEKAYSDKVFKRLGHSYDWDLMYTTIDSEAQKVSQFSFVDLHEKGHVYRAEEPTLWCPHHQTALAQAELEGVDRNTTLNYIYFELVDGGKIEIATTRPELLPACVGIFVHPEDKRYKKLVGKKAVVPLFGQKVKIMKDEHVDMEFGSGIVMICTFGDTNDIEWWKKYKLELKVCVTKDGELNELAGKYKGMKFTEAKQAIIGDIDKEGLLIKQEKLQQNVNTCWRCNTPVEFIVTKQWFIKALDFKKELIKQGRKINWYPDFYRVRYEDWTKNLGWDWCISRQRFYGVPMPIWYCKDCGKEVVAEKSELPIDPTIKKPSKKCKCGSDKFEAENDVFDTWMTSSMSPEISVRWLENPKEFKNRFPISLRPQSHDIIRTWAFYTILKSYLHFNEIPWKDIALGTYILDDKGKGMHKSKGNVVWTHEVLENYDVDTLRYWVGTATWGEDLAFKENDLIAGRKFLTKLWNASRFVLMHLEGYSPKKVELELMDKWLLSKMNKVIKEATDNFMKYNTSVSKKAVEQFFWHDLCDNYLEIVKSALYNEEDSTRKESAKYILYYSLLNVLKLIAPIIPHISEEIYQKYYAEQEGDKSVHISEWPKYEEKLIDKNAEEIGNIVIDVVSAVRRYKTGKGLSLKTELNKLVIECDKKLEEDLKKTFDDLKGTLKVEEIEFGKGKEKVGKVKISIFE
ncbi:valine--tRNA ligase [Candidatus Woesearchaeota archaeon]|nr:valine--tRNA ligase [Candidatus Woesearchaeota archaeon]MBL7051238.1 valine--tRNA ligase [Candidatus Woesearchaeota archaeon]